ncbi:allantoinase [Infundibulicybe gibba]|nr:allantoinase [Infundibulicybe gibba]
MAKLLVCSGQKVLLPEWREPQPATIIIDTSTGKIIDIHYGRPQIEMTSDMASVDAGDSLVIPGLVDAHVHLNEPGRTDWEGFWTGTRAAASANLNIKRQAAQGQCFVDVAFWGGVIPGNQAELKPLIDAGAKGFKCFLIQSGVDEFPHVSEPDLMLAMHELQDSPTILLFHAELEDAELETDAVALIVKLQKLYPSLRCHIVHLSASNALPLVRDAKMQGLKLTTETCFHYLCLSADDIPDGRPEFKCCPPVRGSRNRDELWEGLKSGIIDCVVSDHSPCVAELKKLDEGDVMGAWGGISTLGLGLSLLDVSIAQIVDWTCKRTAEHAGVGGFKGQLKVGYDGDFVVMDPDAEFEITKESLNFKNKISPYVGLKLRGRVEKTFLRGALVYDRMGGGLGGLGPTGKLL